MNSEINVTWYFDDFFFKQDVIYTIFKKNWYLIYYGEKRCILVASKKYINCIHKRNGQYTLVASHDQIAHNIITYEFLPKIFILVSSYKELSRLP